MQELNPVQSLNGSGDDLSRTRLIHEITNGEWDSGSQLAEAADVSRMTVSRFTDSEYVDDLALTDDGVTVLRQVRRAIVNDAREGFRQSGYEVSGLEDIVESWTGLALHPDWVELDTTPKQAKQWIFAILDDHGVDVDDVLDVTAIDNTGDDIELSEAVHNWLLERDDPFFLDDCPHELPEAAVFEIGGGLHVSCVDEDGVDTELREAAEWVKGHGSFRESECPYDRELLQRLGHIQLSVSTPANGAEIWQKYLP